MAKATKATKAPAAPTDLLAALKPKAARKETPADKDNRSVLTLTPAQEEKIGEVIGLCILAEELSPIVEQHKNAGKYELLDIWVQKFWDAKTLPDNPRIIIRKKDESGKPMTEEDMRCLLMIKFRKDGLGKFLPPADEMEKTGKSPTEYIIEALVSVVGLNAKNAAKFAADEVVITDQISLVANINEMYYGEDPLRKSIAGKFLAYLQARSTDKSGTVTLPAYTDEEAQAALVMQTVVTLKDGIAQRLCGYCTTAAELRKLLKFINATITVQNFAFAISDTKAERVDRLSQVVERFLLPAEAAAE